MKTNCHVYVVKGEGNLVKIGSSVHPHVRAGQLSGTLAHSTDVLEQAERIERLAHRILALEGGRVNKTEWFNADVDRAIAAIERATLVAEGLAPEPPLAQTKTPLAIRIDPGLLATLDRFRDSLPHRPSRTTLIEAAIKDLIEHYERQFQRQAAR